MNQMQALQWRLHAKTSEYKGHVRRALSMVRAAMDLGERFMLSWSGGKDSTAMVHLVRSKWPGCPIVSQFDDCDWPEKRPYMERVAKAQGWDIVVVEPGFSVWDAAMKYHVGWENLCAQTHDLTKYAFLRPLHDKQIELGCKGVFMGLRAEESKARDVHLRTRHELYRLSNGEWRCCPFGMWTADDVFAYLVEHDVEINPCYFHNLFKAPQEIRLAWALPTPTGLAHGEEEHIRHYYPTQYNRLRNVGVL